MAALNERALAQAVHAFCAADTDDFDCTPAVRAAILAYHASEPDAVAVERAATLKAETFTVDAVRAVIGGHKVALAEAIERCAWVARHADLPDRPWTPGFYATARQDIADAILADAKARSQP